MSNGVNNQQGAPVQQGTSNLTPFVNFMLTAVPAAIVVVAGWLFGNIFAELQHQRQRQEVLVKEVTALQRDVIALSAQFKDVRLFYRNELVKQGNEINELEKQMQRVNTKVNITQKEREIRAIEALRPQVPTGDSLDKIR